MTIEQVLEGTIPPNLEDLDDNEIRRFFWKYKGLLKERTRNNNFWESTNSNLSKAYEKLDEQETQLERAFNINKKYLDNINEGLLLIDPDYNILNQYSKYLIKLFGKENIEGYSFIDFVYPDTDQRAEDRNELEAFLHILFTNTLAADNMLEDINPLQETSFPVKDSEGNFHEIFVKTLFTRIFSGSKVEYVMVIFQDLTDIVEIQKQLDEEKTRFQNELESISAMLNAGPHRFLEFLDESNEVLDTLVNNYKGIDNPKVLNRLFRDMHSLKGSARYLSLHYISSLAHQVEDKLASIRDSAEGLNEAAYAQIAELTKNIQAEFTNLGILTGKIKSFSGVSHDALDDSNNPLGEFLHSLESMVEEISTELNKTVKLKIQQGISEFPYLKELKNPLIHIIRNSLDHGIEEEIERISKKKDIQGHIKINFNKNDKEFIIDISDDGNGLDFKQIQKKALERNLIDDEVSESALLNLIFTPSFSSKDNVTDISGRGVGLDIVKDAMSQLGGKILVKTKKDIGTRVVLKIPLSKDSLVKDPSGMANPSPVGTQ